MKEYEARPGVAGAADAAVAAKAAKEEAEERILAAEKLLAAMKSDLNKLRMLEREGCLLWDADPDGNCLTSSLVDQMVYAAQTGGLDKEMDEIPDRDAVRILIADTMEKNPADFKDLADITVDDEGVRRKMEEEGMDGEEEFECRTEFAKQQLWKEYLANIRLDKVWLDEPEIHAFVTCMDYHVVVIK